MSPEQMDFLFCDALPQITKDVKTKKLLDVGSRFGAVLYGVRHPLCGVIMVKVDISN